ncbi:uncharacterized protein LOC109949772 isoform X4 [Prunus persica]|uniref:uncharacterized protein LOC109949772 isoform X4 n=1 Tax=Prunus persica TaxID=3760 RepID=UPI0009AB46FA|nr:uncharacterized protein LOC109949772 isoform X4 [Prunus persica]
MTNKVNMEEIIAYNMKAKSYCPYDLSVLRMPINICTEEQSFLTYESWRCFFTAKDLQEAWPVLKSALKEITAAAGGFESLSAQTSCAISWSILAHLFSRQSP